MDEKLISLKALLGIADNSEDELLAVLLTQAGQKITRAVYPYVEDISGIDVPSRYDFLQLEVAERMYNKRGAEGEKEHIENGTHRTYESVEEFIQNNVVPFCGVPKVVQ